MTQSLRIPTEWRNRVCTILRKQIKGTIHVTLRAKLDWESTFPHSFTHDLYNALDDALSVEDVMGTRKYMNEPGEAYEFFFSHEQRTMYGKVLLTPNGVSINIISAHRPLK